MDGMGVPPPPDGQGTPPPPSHVVTPDGRGIPPPPTDLGELQIRETVLFTDVEPRLQQSRVHCQLRYAGEDCEASASDRVNVRKGLLKKNNTSTISTPTRDEHRVRFDLPNRREWREVDKHVPSRSSGPTPPIVSTIATQSSGQGCRNVRNIDEHKNRTKVKTKESGKKLTWMPKSDKAAKDLVH